MFCLQYFHPKYKIVQNCVQYCVIDGKMLILFHILYKIVQFYFNVKYFEIVIIFQFSQAFLRALSEATISENEQRRMQELCSRNGKDLFIVVFYPSTPVKWRCVHHYQLKCSPAKLFFRAPTKVPLAQGLFTNPEKCVASGTCVLQRGQRDELCETLTLYKYDGRNSNLFVLS